MEDFMCCSIWQNNSQKQKNFEEGNANEYHILPSSCLKK